jgi:hypothetical protein
MFPREGWTAQQAKSDSLINHWNFLALVFIGDEAFATIGFE